MIQIILSLILALILTLCPMPHWLILSRPVWVLLVLFFWALILPGRLIITLAWIVGIFLDVLSGTLLGEHAIALTLVTYLVSRLNNQLWMFSLSFSKGLASFLWYYFINLFYFVFKDFSVSYQEDGFIGYQH